MKRTCDQTERDRDLKISGFVKPSMQWSTWGRILTWAGEPQLSRAGARANHREARNGRGRVTFNFAGAITKHGSFQEARQVRGHPCPRTGVSADRGVCRQGCPKTPYLNLHTGLAGVLCFFLMKKDEKAKTKTLTTYNIVLS